MPTTRPVLFLIGVFLIAAAQLAFANENRVCSNSGWYGGAAYHPTKADMSWMPEWCGLALCKWDTGRPDSATRKEIWRSRLGPIWIHVHHYCAGLGYQHKARLTFGQKREYNLRRALGEIRYVTSKIDSYSSPINAEMLRREAEVHEMMGNPSEAIRTYQKSLLHNRRYTPSYAGISDLLLEHGEYEAAKKVLYAGLQVAPESKLLAKRLTALKRRESGDGQSPE